MIRLSVRMRGADDGGVVLAELLALSPAGVEERALADGTEYVIYGAPGELPALPDLRAAAGDVLVDVSSEEIADDWGERWKRWHKPLELDGLRVRPPWERVGGPDTGIDLVIDPGQAFGTGAHATTRLCLELLLTLPATGSFADWGCGSGVLAIAAARLGFDPVIAVDHDPLAVTATRENARANGIDLDVAQFNLRDSPGPAAETVCANLLAPLLRAVAGLTPAAAPAKLIVSGLLSEEAEEVAHRFGRPVRERRDRDGWAALLLG